MSTRTAEDSSVYHQNRYASAAEFELGLIANLVAKRCAILDDKPDRELLWFVQYLSHQPGGLAAIANDLIKIFPHRLGTRSMVAIGKSSDQKYDANEVCQIRSEIPTGLRNEFPLRGEVEKEVRRTASQLNAAASRARMAIENEDYENGDGRRSLERCIESAKEADSELNAEVTASEKYPTGYPAQNFLDLCRLAAETGSGLKAETLNLEKVFFDLCLKPVRELNESSPWYFSDLIQVLREYQLKWVEDKSKVVVTALGKKICDTLDYTLHSRSLTLIEGNARMGKSFSARSWCLQRAGVARFIEIPGSNDDATFFRAIARGLGLGNFLKYKVAEIRERVESVLLSGDLLLVLDEAQRLWPQRNLRYGFPSRIIWVMTMANAGVPICMVSTPQFIVSQKAVEKNGWNSAQLTGRLGHYEFLPVELEVDDLIAVGRAVLPEASGEILKALAFYARTSARYLAAIDSIAKRAEYLALRSGRANCTAEDVRVAMKESVIPSDTMLARTLELAKKTTDCRKQLPPMPAEVSIEAPAPIRAIRPAPAEPSAFSRCMSDADKLVQG